MNSQGGRESYEVSEEADMYEWLADRAEAEYFAHIEGVTHENPHLPTNRQTAIISVNEPIDWSNPW